MQRKNEDVSEAEHEAHAPPCKRRKLSPESTGQSYTETSYANTYTHGNAHAHYGHVFNNYTNQAPQMFMHPMSSPVFQDRQSSNSDAASLITTLRFGDMDSRLATIRSAHHGTCEWLFEREEYKAWRTWQDPTQPHKHEGFLWLKGKPGTGKSTVMKSAYTHGVNTLPGDVILSYFFSARGGHLQSSAEGMYRSLLCQLLAKFPGLASLQNLKLRPDQPHVIWHKERLRAAILEAVLAVFPRPRHTHVTGAIYEDESFNAQDIFDLSQGQYLQSHFGQRQLTCYVDAIDECDYSDAQDIIDFFQDLYRRLRKSLVKVFVLVSSRHYPQVSCQGGQQIILEHEVGHNTDLLLYIESKLQIGDSRKARNIKGAIQRKASGIFLWVVLIVRILNEDKARGKVHLLEDHLQSLPKDLHRLFENIVQCDSDNNSGLLLTVQLLFFADRPLRPEEVYFALISNESRGAVQDWDHDELSTTDMKNFILDSSRGLAEVVEFGQPSVWVQFIHESVRDYLRDMWLPSVYNLTTQSLSALCHDRLKQCCQQYVLRCSPEVLQTVRNRVQESKTECATYPFLSYALFGMVWHANTSQSLGCQQHDFIGTFDAELWLRLHDHPWSRALPACYRTKKKASREYIFVLENAVHLTELSLQQLAISSKGCVDPMGKTYGTLLGAAVSNGYSTMVEMLLEQGADPNAAMEYQPTIGLLSKPGFTPSTMIGFNYRCLDVASILGSMAIVRTLLGHNAAVQRRAPKPWTPSTLRLAAQSNMTDIVGTLLAHYNLDHWHPDMGHVLEAAVYHRNGNMAQLLYGRMIDSRKAIAQMMSEAISRSSSVVRYFDLYYHDFRNQRRPALLDLIHRANEHYSMLGPKALVQCVKVVRPWAIRYLARALLVLLRRDMSVSSLAIRLWAHPALIDVAGAAADHQFFVKGSTFDDDWDSLFRNIGRTFWQHPQVDRTTSNQFHDFANANANVYYISQTRHVYVRNGTRPTFARILAPGSYVRIRVRFKSLASHNPLRDGLYLKVNIMSKNGHALQVLAKAGNAVPKRSSW